ncbi:MAG: hypothetical protein O3C65_10570 [Proteobacteria bacterium]|nr:hypothetical protein [Pseudomonadota bacterium]MDA1059118.1 hypothetical protein [Pseudomonadota bacterium]
MHERSIRNAPPNYQLPLRPRPIGQPKHELAIHESLDMIIAAGVASNGAVALAGAPEIAGQVRSLMFLLADGWMLEVPVSKPIVDQLRQIVGTFEARQ